MKKKGARARLPDSAVFFFACVGKFVITLRLTTWNGKNVSTPGLFLAFNNTCTNTVSRTLNQCTHSHTHTHRVSFLNSEKSVKVITLLSPYIIMCIWGAFPSPSLCFLSSLSLLSCLFHALHSSMLIASCSLFTHTERERAQTGVFSTPHSFLFFSSSFSMVLHHCCEPLYTQVAIIADLIPNSQLASTQRSPLIIYQLPQHPWPTLDQWAQCSLFSLSLFFNTGKVDWSQVCCALRF